MHQLSHQTQNALKSLSHCAITCHSMALVHCLELGGEHARPQHIRLMLDCATICTTTAEFVAHKSQFHTQICSLCVEKSWARWRRVWKPAGAAPPIAGSSRAPIMPEL